MQTSTLISQLRASTAAEIRSDSASLAAYSVDASLYTITPTLIVLPKTCEDLIATVKIAAQHNLPITPRGAATGITGGCLGSGIIIDTSKFLTTLLEINLTEEYALVEPGVVQDRLNEALDPLGYRLGPDTSTGNRATLGGMVANNAAGARSLYFGKMVDHVEGVELVLASGEVVWLDENAPSFREEIAPLIQKHQKAIEQHFPKIPRRVSGYNLDELLKSPLNLSKLIVGSEGSLGLITKIKVKICKKPTISGLCIIHFNDMIEAMRAIPAMLKYNPISLEMIDAKILEAARQSPVVKEKLGWLEGEPKVIFVAELTKDVDAFATAMQQQKVGYAHTLLKEKEAQKQMWEVRKAGLGLLMSKRTYRRAVAFIEDISVPPVNLPSFMEKFLKLLNEHGKEAGIYGHVGSGCLHIRPYLDLHSEEEVDLIKTLMLAVADLLLNYGGALSGEHGDGLIRSWLNEKMFGKEIYQAFCAIKTLFDPENRMNPGKVVHGPPLEDHLKHPVISNPKTTFQFGEGGLALAVDMCNGNGQCRKMEGVMCPSYQATKDEYDTTRARAQALRAALEGRSTLSLTSPEVHAILDLCLECKGCKKECPSQVDMAKMKAEFLYHYHKKHGIPLRTRLFGHIASFYKIASHFPRFANGMSRSWIGKKAQEWLGIAPERELPPLALQRFSASHKPTPSSSKKVILFNDTYTEFLEPNIGHSALQVLKALGYEVIIPDWHCCGRPLISKGMLNQARHQAEKLIAHLSQYDDLPIIGLEPSCLLTIADDYPSLLGEQCRSIAKRCILFDTFIAQHEFPLPPQEHPIKVHGHCHQKALVGMSDTLKILNNAEEIPSGCCGMAGSFGYEKEHYALSMKIGELKLFPAARHSTTLIANGFSCRSQLKQIGKPSLHLAEFLAKSLP